MDSGLVELGQIEQQGQDQEKFYLGQCLYLLILKLFCFDNEIGFLVEDFLILYIYNLDWYELMSKVMCIYIF